ncbi:4-hydroxy-tetrahydrodipicolinate reductase [Ornithinimicrobium sp. Y1847]|uniref:4-hydroxy-tetrahydrodipicolinate reductase n=1 Tax=Ornithinimicrobium sp. Y1847 TaxID=3405419 RepID=UPI003B674630
MLTLGLLGTGRLGTAIRDAAASTEDLEIGWAIGRGTPPAQPVEVAIDVSHPDAVAGHLTWAEDTGIPLVIGTTGWDVALVAAPDVPVLVAPNFSLGVAVVRHLAHLLGRYAAATAPGAGRPMVDLAVTETHHRHKVDSPSGTALTLREALASGAGREATEVQTTSLRLGSVVGEHAVIASSPLETISIRHSAHDRGLFADGALAAARWLVTQPPGRYGLDDLAADLLPELAPCPAATHPSSTRSTPGSSTTHPLENPSRGDSPHENTPHERSA